MASSVIDSLREINKFKEQNIKNIFNDQGSNPLSYAAFIRDLMNFRKAGGNETDDLGVYDTPGHYFFKILFSFWNGDSDMGGDVGASGGLLAPTWMMDQFKGKRIQEVARTSNDLLMSHTSAWSYLVMNLEWNRAELLEKFVTLLSDISSNSPWYFTSISGISGALKRDMISTNTVALPTDKQKIQIKCLPDAQDNRIGTLIDLYRSIVWSWTRKCEVLPVNLRKFDMNIYIFSSPILNLHDIENTVIGPYKNSKNYVTSYKMLEFHGCEIDYNSPSNLNDSISNDKGFSLEYTIDINYDEVYETRWNDIMMREFGDMIISDTISVITNDHLSSSYNVSIAPQQDDEQYAAELQKRTNKYKDGILLNTQEEQNKLMDLISKFGDSVVDSLGGFVSGLTDQVVGVVKDTVMGAINSVVLGNLHGFSLSRMGEQLEQLASGQIIQTIQNIGDYARNTEMGAGLSGGFLMDQGRKILQSTTGDAMGLASEIADTTKNLNDISERNKGQRDNGGDLGRIFNGKGAASAANTIASNL